MRSKNSFIVCIMSMIGGIFFLILALFFQIMVAFSDQVQYYAQEFLSATNLSMSISELIRFLVIGMWLYAFVAVAIAVVGLLAYLKNNAKLKFALVVLLAVCCAYFLISVVSAYFDLTVIILILYLAFELVFAIRAWKEKPALAQETNIYGNMTNMNMAPTTEEKMVIDIDETDDATVTKEDEIDDKDSESF